MTGVYFLYLNKQLQYIGKSIDLDRRLEKHEFKHDFSGIIICDRQDLDQLEKDQIRQNRPPLNKRIYKHYNLKKRQLIAISMEPEFHKHLKEIARKKKATLSLYVRAALRKVSGYKEKELVWSSKTPQKQV